MIYVLIIAFFACLFISCVVENEDMPKEKKYRWFACFIGLTTWVYLLAFMKG